MKFINKELWLFVVATHGDVYSNATIHVPPLLKSLLCVVLGHVPPLLKSLLCVVLGHVPPLLKSLLCVVLRHVPPLLKSLLCVVLGHVPPLLKSLLCVVLRHVPPLLKSLLCVVLGYEQVRLPFTSPCSSLFGCKQCFAKLVRIQNNIDLCVSGHIGQLSRARVAYLLPPFYSNSQLVASS